jgi:hypothetical protein
MTQRWYVRAALAVLIGMGVAVGLARAQPPAPVPGPDPQPWAVIDYGSGQPFPPDSPPAAEAPGAPHRSVRDWIHNRPHPVQDYIHDCLHEHGVGCWSHHNAYLCSSWKSECTFVFGSCRAFFGEPCLIGPPPSPLPPGYGPPPQQPGCAHCR